MKNTDGMMCAIKSDFFKLKKQKSVWIGLILMFVLILISYCVYWLFIDIITSSDVPSNDMNIYIVFQEVLGLSKSNIANFSEICGLTLSMAIIACLFIGKDFSNGAMRLSVSRGANRVQLYFSKLICLFLLALAYSAITILICGIFTSFKGYGEPFTALQFGLLMRCFALQTLCNLSTISIIVMIAFLCRSSGSALGTAIGGAIVISIISGLVTGLQAFSDNPYWIYFMPLQQNALAGLMTDYNATQLCAVIIMPIVYGVASTAIGLTSFLKRDIK